MMFLSSQSNGEPDMNSFYGKAQEAAARLARVYVTQMRRRRAARLIDGLPPHLRKDIGWPDPAMSDPHFDRFRQY